MALPSSPKFFGSCLIILFLALVQVHIASSVMIMALKHKNHHPLRPFLQTNQTTCALFVGTWVRDETYPMYQASACPVIDAEFNCQMYGRPDSDYLKFRWKPLNCELPRFNGVAFLSKMRGKTVMFVGDSLGRNQWESMSASCSEAKMSFQDLDYGAKRSSPSVAGRTAPHSSSQAVAAGIFQINTGVSAFRRLVDAIGTSKDTPDHRQKLHNTRQRILQLVKETSAKLKSVSESDRGTNVNPNKKIEDAKLARDFQSILQEFQKVQQQASERESAYSPSAPSSSLPTIKSSGSGEILALGMDQENQPLVGQKRQELMLLGNEISFNEAIIEERELGIREIQDQIGEASEIFKDLAVLVHEQGVVIEDVHSHIESSSAVTKQARVQLSKASKNTKSRSKWCWWVLGVSIVVVVIIVIILVV